MKNAVILWDGFVKINGFLEVSDSYLNFQFADFNSSNIAFKILIENIKIVRPHYLYKLEVKGFEVISKDGSSSIFISNESEYIMSKINSHKN